MSSLTWPSSFLDLTLVFRSIGWVLLFCIFSTLWSMAKWLDSGSGPNRSVFVIVHVCWSWTWYRWSIYECSFRSVTFNMFINDKFVFRERFQIKKCKILPPTQSLWVREPWLNGFISVIARTVWYQDKSYCRRRYTEAVFQGESIVIRTRMSNLDVYQGTTI